jgi:hypothetical protein
MTAPDGTFGPSTGGWGDPTSEDDESTPAGDLGDGIHLTINEEAWKGLLNSAEAQSGVVARAVVIRDQANSLVAMDPRAVERLNPSGKRAYEYSLNTEVGRFSRVRGRVHPSYDEDNSLGFVDDAVNSTLLKSMAAEDTGQEAGDE